MRGRIVFLALLAMLIAGSAALAAPFKDCPLTGVMPNYEATAAPELRNWDTLTLTVADGDNQKEIKPQGAICVQDYTEKQGKTDGSALEIMENYKEAMKQQGAEILLDHSDYVVGHLTKDGQEYWINVSASRDDGYAVKEVAVAPLKRSLLAPSGNDYRLLGHMPGYVAGTPNKKNFDEHAFPIEGGEVAIRGALYTVDYQEPEKKPDQRVVTASEILENYRAALRDLNAEILRDTDENVTARVDDNGKTVYLFVSASSVIAVEEKPFQLTIKPPTADEMKDKLDKDGHIALYVNFDFAKATLKADAAPVIAQIVDLLKRNPDLKVSIDGHTDSVGGHDYNLKLSQDRAAAVVAAITAAGIDASRLTSEGFGPDKPIAPNDTDEGRAKNRRVELVKAS